MASRKRTRKNKIQPAVLTITTAITGVPGFGSVDATADLSQMASILNRRFYRQGLNWAVAGIKISSDVTGSVDIAKLPNTWVMSNAWEKGFRAYMEMINKAADEDTDVKGKFLDFKIYADSVHHNSGKASNLLPLDALGNTATAGEWLMSDISIPHSPGVSTQYEIIGVGDNYPGVGASGQDAISLIQGYANSRALPSESDPNTPGELSDASGVTPENWLSAIFNEGTSQDSFVLNEARNSDQPPYPYEGDGTAITTMYPGGADQLPGLQVHDYVNFSPTTISSTGYAKGGNFPCGLMRFRATNTTEGLGNFLLQIDLVPGSHRGYMAEPMMEM